MAVKIKAALMLAHLNIRKEKAGEDEGPVACDVKLSGEIGFKEVKNLFSTKSAFEVLAGLYQKGGELITHDIATMRLAGEAKNVEASLAVEGGGKVTFEGAKLNKISLQPKPGHIVELSLRLQVHPSGDQHAKLAELLGSTVILEANATQLDLHLDQEEEEEEEEEEQPALA